MSYQSGWGFTRREPGVDALAEWVDTVQKRNPSQRWGIWGGVIGGLGGLIGGWLGVSLGGLNLSAESPMVWTPVILAIVATLWMTAWVIKKGKTEVGEWSRESRGVMTRVLVARWHGNLRNLLGDDGATTMNQAADIWLKCRTSLDSPAWKAAAGSRTWGDVREKAMTSLDAAMARMLLLVTSGSLAETQSLISDMQAMHDEVSRAAARHSAVTGTPLGGSEGLRQTLAEMRELAAADEEYLGVRSDN